ncbi:MAG TPA: hypothetical protein DCL54_10735 [Alphaproteobacteria bacterium]|nr:hypothetical protein [Alphaproteobacteria bacterium]HAJ47044.1 hypothetical protein [Alphaproteobacteria bacterium]
MKLADRIVADADTCSGHPRVDGTRIRVSQILGMLAAGMTPEEIVADYPPVSVADIQACLAFAASKIDVPSAAE